MINCVWCLLWCLVISQGWCAFPELCSNSDVGAHYGDQSTLPGYEMWPPSVDSSAGGTDIQKWYKVGLDDCNKFLAINKAKYLATETPRPFVAPTAIRGSQSLCRGNEMLYKLTGAITWIFGPGISQATEGSSNYTCPVGHNCWFGVLTCDGSLTSGSKHSEIKHNYIRDTSEYLLNYNRWKQKQFPGLVDKDYPTEDRHGFLYYHNASYGTNSLSPRALHMNMRIAGDEVVTPYVRYTTMPILHDTGTASGDGTKLVSRSPMVSLVDVLIANYTLTIPSTIRAVIEAKILWFYPGKLFNFPAPNHPSESHKFTGKADTGIPTSLYGENWDRMGSIFMGGSEYRCKTNGGCKVPNDCCGCDDRTRVPNSPVLVNIPVLNSASVASTGHGGDSNSDSNSDSKSGSSSSNVCGNSTDLSLPLCLNGNHYGRWLRLPSELRELCHQRLDSRNVQIKFSGIANTAVKGSDARRRGLYRELMRYTDGSNICTLMDVSVSAMSLPTDDIDQLMLYAPYSCRYSIYSAEQINAILSSNKAMHANAKPEFTVAVREILFHGDSMSRDLFGVVNRLLGISSLSNDSLKKQLNAKIVKGASDILQTQSRESAIRLNELYTWHGDDNSIEQLKKGSPVQAYIMNFALAHSIHEARTNDIDFDRMVYQCPAVKYWYDNKAQVTDYPVPAFRIFQTGKEMQGLRNPYKEWTSENFVQMSNVLKLHYVTMLGFFELNEFILTTGRMDLTDGWHFGGNTKLMEGVIFFNILCNNK